ncbi:signal peptidase I [Dactylosporangium sp. AC04546]|uniref:signal peptidase I n=1 Tax=Dactylosporangium sp. AC04546 TaxID=2862460 RepID=UPI001EDF3006|nr:signal peptidase I [Dactylosporangium sp. AC04546]WVK85256.1 signal peptidase I [Dactylosporangium sp. AC04546]
MIDEQTKKRGSFWRELPVLLGVAIIVAVVVRAFVLQTFFIPSESMENTLLIKDRVLVNKLVYDFRSPHRGEVIVFEAPNSWRNDPSEVDFIKRVIGVGGDHIVCCDDKQRITVNGTPLDETYIYTNEDGLQDLPSEEQFDVTVPKGRLWVMGDHRSRSGDSRYNFIRMNKDPVQATISEDDVIGRAFVVFWPFSRAKWLSVPDTFEKVPSPAAR